MSLNAKFSRDHFSMLLNNGQREQALVYQKQFTHKKKKDETDEKDRLVKELKDYGVAAARHWKLETLQERLEKEMEKAELEMDSIEGGEELEEFEEIEEVEE